MKFFQSRTIGDHSDFISFYWATRIMFYLGYVDLFVWHANRNIVIWVQNYKRKSVSWTKWQNNKLIKNNCFYKKTYSTCSDIVRRERTGFCLSWLFSIWCRPSVRCSPNHRPTENILELISTPLEYRRRVDMILGRRPIIVLRVAAIETARMSRIDIIKRYSRKSQLRPWSWSGNPIDPESFPFFGKWIIYTPLLVFLLFYAKLFSISGRGAQKRSPRSRNLIYACCLLYSKQSNNEKGKTSKTDK